ncbi:MAG: hypothetical protein STHCBS139747_006966 [Sporothrix thermara]
MLPRWTTTTSTSNAEDATSPTQTAASLLMRVRFGGARFRRLLIALASLVVISFCIFHLSSDQNQLLRVSDNMRHLPWRRPSADATSAADELAELAELAGMSGLSPVDADSYVTEATTRLPHIPAKIWQIYLDFQPNALSVPYLTTWLFRSPSYSYTILDKAGALGLVSRLASIANAQESGRRVPVYPDIVATKPAMEGAEIEGGPKEENQKKEQGEDKAQEEKEVQEETKTQITKRGEKRPHVELHQSSPVQMRNLAFARDVLQQYKAMPRRVLRADFLRYLVLALEGGIYSDVDTHLVRDIRDWVPAEFRAKTRLIVGLEADSSPPVKGTTYEVQFCQWTLASDADHPTMWTMLDRILARVRTIQGGLLGTKLSDKDVLAITGPAAWTEVVFEHLDQVAGTGVGQPRITWETLTGMTKPQLYGDTLVLPIDGFATGVPHSHASQRNTDQTLIRHQFLGQWRGDRG